jgi:AraC-like DNA-binding protein
MTQAPNVVTKTPEATPAVDVAARRRVLDDVLRMVRLSGAVFLKGEFARPWGFDSPSSTDLTSVLAPGAQQLVLFHAVLEGSCSVTLDTGERADLQAGDLVVLPYGNQHRMFNPDGSEVVPIADLLPPPPWANMQICRFGPPEEVSTRILCSYLECRDLLFNPFLRALPRLLKVTPTPGPEAEWLAASVRYAHQQTSPGTPDLLRQRIPEMLLVEALRHHLENQPAERTGWMAALADAVVGPALVRIHQDPSRAWTVNSLADELAVSRSVLAARFVERLGQSPMRYLALWRLQLAAHELLNEGSSISETAIRIGYESEAAFSRAFKRHVGVAPGAWREKERG